MQEWLDEAYDFAQPRIIGHESWRSFIANFYEGRSDALAIDMSALLKVKSAVAHKLSKELMNLCQAYSELSGLVPLPELQSDNNVLASFSALFSSGRHSPEKWEKFIGVMNAVPVDYSVMILRYVPELYCDDALVVLKSLKNKTDGDSAEGWQITMFILEKMKEKRKKNSRE